MTDVLKIGKRAFTWSVVVTTVLWSIGASALVPLVANAQSASCPSLSAGDLFKVTGNSAVYLLNADMNRMYFPNSALYHSWYQDFSGVVEMSPTCVDAYPAPSSAPFGVNYRPGSSLVKLQISPSVYVIEPGNKISKLGSEAVAAALYGSNWATKVVDVADVFWPNYSGRGSEVTEAVPHNGMLVSKSGSSDVYQVVGGETVKVVGSVRGNVQTVSETVFNKVSMNSGTVTAASVYANPAQTVAGGPVTPPVTPGTPSSTGTLTVGLAADTASGTYAVNNAARVQFTKVNLTATGGDVVIKSFMVRRGGQPATNDDFSKINVVLPNQTLINDSGKTLNADNKATFTEDIVIPSGQTIAIWLVADMVAAVGGGNVPTLDLYSVETDSPVVGSLPIVGNIVTTNANVALGSVTLTEGASIGTVTKQVGTTNVNLANLTVTVSTNDFQIEHIILDNSGTTSDGDVENIRLTYNSNTIATGKLSSKTLSFDLSACTADCKVLKGNNKTFAVYGDLVGGSARTINLDVKKAVHVLTKDLKQGYYATPTYGTVSAAAMTNTVTVSQGKLNVTKVNNVQTGNVPESASQVSLGSWNFKVTGEPIDISTLVFKITTTGTVVPTGFDSITLYDAAGKALTSGVDGTLANSPGYATSTDTITLQPGDNILTVKASIDSTPATGDTVLFGIDMTNTNNFVSTGVNSGETITLGGATPYATPNSVVSANTMTIKSGSLRVTSLSTPSAQTFAPGTNDVLFAKVQLDATDSSEDLKVSQFIISDATSALAKTIDIQSIRLFVDKDGDSFNGTGTMVALSETQSGSDSDAGDDEDFTFNLSGDDQFVVKKGKKLVVEVKANIAGGATAGTHTFSVNTANDITAVGQDTNSQVVEVIDTAASNAMTIGTSGGQIQVAIDSSTPVARLFAAGTTGATLASFNFLATTTEDVEVETIQFTMRVTPTASSSFQDYQSLYLEDENGVVLGSVTPTTTLPTMSFGEDKFVVRTNDSDGMIVYLKANLATIGTAGSGNPISVGGHRLGFNIGAASDVIAKGNLTGAGANEYLASGSSAPNGNTHLLYKATPTVTKLAVGATLTNGTNDLYKFQVSAGTSDIGLYKFTFDMTTTGVNVTSLELVDVTDSAEVSLYSLANSTASVAWSNGFVETLFDTDSSGTGSGGEERTVSKTKPRTYVLRGTVSGASSGDSISTRLGGDATNFAFGTTLMASSTQVDASVHDDFIWSDKSIGGHATTTNDWTNGYVVSGLNSTSSTPAVLSL